jgi:hypothetical protein
MNERGGAYLAPACDQAQDKDVAYPGNGARVGHPEFLGVDPGGIGAGAGE